MFIRNKKVRCRVLCETRNVAAVCRTRPDWAALPGLFFLCLSLCIASAEPGDKPPAGDLTALSLEDLMNIEIPKVTGASKFEQKATEAPSSITVVTAEDVKRHGYRTLGEILQSVQGFYVSYDRNYAYLGARGINFGDFNSRILLLIDGHRINNNLSDGAAIDTAFLLDVDLIDRVEIIRGPGSVLYGNNAFFAVINVITRQGGQLNGVEVSGEYGSFETFKGRLTFGREFTNGLRLLLSGSISDSDGQKQLYYPEFDQRISANPGAVNNGVAENLDGDFYGSAFGSVGFKDVTLQGGHVRREKANPTALIGANFNEQGHGTTDERSYAALKIAHSFPAVVDVTAQVYYDRYNMALSYPSAPSLFQDTMAGEWWGAELQLDKRLFDRHIITVGAEFRDDFRQDLVGEEKTAGTIYNDVSRSRQSHGVYAQGDFAVFTNLHVNAGARYDKYSGFAPAFNPRVAIIYNPFEQSTFKALYGTAFRVPNFVELSDPRFQNINPEEITSYELVYEQGLGRHLRTSASVFYNRMDDLIVLRDGAFTNFNADTKGLELALDGSWTNGIRCRVSYSLQDSQDRSTGTLLADSPTHLVKASLSVPVYQDKIFAGLEVQYTSDRHTIFTSATGGATMTGRDAPGFAVVNLTLYSRNLVKNLEFSAGVYNLFDASYGDPASRFHQQDILERDGRSFRVKLTYRF